MDHRVDYTIFAQVYDRLMDKTMYQSWQDFVTQHYPQSAPGRLLDLGCGTGDFAVRMAKLGWRVTGLDLSADMLTLAKERADKAHVTVDWIQGDMRQLAGLGTFDVVTSFDDSICYLPDLASVQATFEAVAGVLPADCPFFFDVHSLHQVDDVFPGFMFNDITEDSAFLWSSYEGKVPHSVEHELTFFTYDDTIDGYTRAMEIQTERTYPAADYRQALIQAGFLPPQLTADFGRGEVQPDTTRWFWQAVRAHA
ncbi:class I SAM-dependent DNA methyltransferase [Schleiferilactobacillus perolens]|jgi:SAM-dependent methyltransferase|uniref:class I SAM-dependent DNA methyltransferase n=1 Tax=Schleiferilactobacillus perolens TaxID=100468 RepID=UPI00235597A3|nr:class I SAM-dependent methyltransferase [Schleiferilactobacillus perolens]MCI2171849.1 class I SAM-dependent methyltransferase [Schleiferilactobacillus perolens]